MAWVETKKSCEKDEGVDSYETGATSIVTQIMIYRPTCKREVFPG